MKTASRSVIETGGRYKWVVRPGSTTSGYPKVWDSAVSFATRDEAEDDLDAFLRLNQDATGAFIRSKADIDELLVAAVTGREGCDGFWFAKVQWQEPDEVGCNWFFRDFRYDIVGCIGQILSEIDCLRRMYRIPDERASLSPRLFS